jgi:membrane fusion protein (multidrug efflux system)
MVCPDGARRAARAFIHLTELHSGTVREVKTDGPCLSGEAGRRPPDDCTILATGSAALRLAGLDLPRRWHRIAAGVGVQRNTPAAGEGMRRPRFVGLSARLTVIAVVAVVAVSYGGYETYMRMTHVHESDARVTADIVTMSSRADGWVVEMPALEGARVTASQIVVRIDDRVAKLRADALRAQIAVIRSDRTRLEAERHMVENEAEAKMRTRASAVRASQAARAALDSDILLAKQELARSRRLYERRVITDKQLETAQANVARLENTRRRMDAEREQAEGSLAEAEVERDRLAVIDGQLAGLKHAEANLQAQLNQQMVDVEDRTIRSPLPAVIDRTFVLTGEYVSAGQRILMLHDPTEVWVEANIKETQLRHLRLGQPVEISVDAFPDERFVGRVARIGSSTTARFALLPTPNPSGNFTKITQRVPVKIDIVDMPRPLVPGMMVEVSIDVR